MAKLEVDGATGASRRTPRRDVDANGAVAPENRFTDEYLPYLLAQASAIACAQFAGPLRASGLSPVAWRTLATLCDGKGMTIGELSRIVLTQQPRVTQVVTDLETKGLITREQDKADRRRTIVFITEKGRQSTVDLLRTAKENEEFALEALTGPELARLKALLRQLIARAWVEKVAPIDDGRG